MLAVRIVQEAYGGTLLRSVDACRVGALRQTQELAVLEAATSTARLVSMAIDRYVLASMNMQVWECALRPSPMNSGL